MRHGKKVVAAAWVPAKTSEALSKRKQHSNEQEGRELFPWCDLRGCHGYRSVYRCQASFCKNSLIALDLEVICRLKNSLFKNTVNVLNSIS